MKPLLALDDPRAPRFWMHETSGMLAPVVQAYLEGNAMTPPQVATMRAYLKQWIASPVWGDDPTIDKLRDQVQTLHTRAQVAAWLHDALDLGIDPL
jgi:hypothetical protein